MRKALVIIVAFVAATASASEPRYTEAWSADTQAASEAAVARLGANRALDLRPVVVNVVGLQAIGVAGMSQGVVATVEQLRQAMTALNAEETATEISIELPADVLFDFDKADIRADAAQALAHLATVIRANPNGHTRLEGHTDAVGNDAYNQRLSERRAESVKQWLVSREQIDASKLIPKGWGKTRPVAPNDTDANRQKNRRLKAIIEKK